MEESAGDTSKPKQDESKVEPAGAPAASTNPAAAATEDVPDPDEDDLDDLDDMLDEFSTVKLAPKEPDTAASGPGRPSSAPATDGAVASAPDPEAALSEDDFAQQLQAGMADLLGEMENSPEVQAQFESFFNQFNAAAGDAVGEGGAAGASTSGAAAGADASFQETIRKTMERMQNSGEQATAAATSEGTDDFMAELMKQMQSGGLDGAEGGEEDFSKMLLGMMEQLTNKEILYEPMKELHEKFPDWLEKNKDKTPEEDLKRYEEQQALVKEIVAKFEESTYADSNAADREYIVDRMQKMQAAGSPPSDLVGDMPSAQDALGGLGGPDESCNPQ